MHHWAAFFALGYAISGEAASRWNENREWEQAGRDPSRVDQSDILLGNAAAYMGGEMLAPWVGIGFSNIGSMLCTFVPIRGGGCG